MAGLPRLAWVTLSSEQDDKRFTAQLVGDDNNCVCTVQVKTAQMKMSALVETTLIREIRRVSPRQVELSLTHHDRNEQMYTVRFELTNTSMPEGIQIVRQLFDVEFPGLTVRYWYEVGRGDTVLGQLIAEDFHSAETPRYILFTLARGDDRSTFELWERFGHAIIDTDVCAAYGLTAEGDSLMLVLTKQAWANLLPSLLEVVRLFQFNPNEAAG